MHVLSTYGSSVPSSLQGKPVLSHFTPLPVLLPLPDPHLKSYSSFQVDKDHLPCEAPLALLALLGRAQLSLLRTTPLVLVALTTLSSPLCLSWFCPGRTSGQGAIPPPHVPRGPSLLALWWGRWVVVSGGWVCKAAF